MQKPEPPEIVGADGAGMPPPSLHMIGGARAIDELAPHCGTRPSC
ncbi:hypothetical protein [Streptomyces sp. NPDC005209]